METFRSAKRLSMKAGFKSLRKNNPNNNTNKFIPGTYQQYKGLHCSRKMAHAKAFCESYAHEVTSQRTTLSAVCHVAAGIFLIAFA